MSVRLYIGNLPKEEVERQELQAVFAEEGESVVTKVIKDRKTGKCRGFGFVTVNDDEHADKIIEKYNGQLFKDSPIKLEKALPRTKGQDEEGQAAPVGNESGSNGSNANPEKAASNRRSNNKKSRRPASTSSSNENSDAVQPDPRWATELEKLKQMLAAQTTNG